MNIVFVRVNGEVKYFYEYKPTVLGGETERTQVERFIADMAKYYIRDDNKLGIYEYEILGGDEFLFRGPLKG